MLNCCFTDVDSAEYKMSLKIKSHDGRLEMDVTTLYKLEFVPGAFMAWLKDLRIALNFAGLAWTIGESERPPEENEERGNMDACMIMWAMIKPPELRDAVLKAKIGLIALNTVLEACRA